MWDVEFPPYNIALIRSVLRKNNFESDCFDLNRDFYASVPGEQHLWSLSDIYAFWQSKEEVGKLILRHKTVIDGFLLQLEPYDILGFTLQSLNFTFTLILIKAIRKVSPHKIILAGGPECFRNFNPEYLMQCACFDALCYGEAEEALPELLYKTRQRRTWKTPGFFIKEDQNYIDCAPAHLVENLDNLPFADFSFLKKDTERICVSTSRGCIGNCSFCHEKGHWDAFRYRSAGSVVEEISLLKERFPFLRFVYLNDSLINGNTEEFSRFCELMIRKKLGINWGGHMLIRKEMTKGFLKEMKQAGAERLNFGVESGSNQVLQLMRKAFRREDALRILADTKRAGISFSVNFVIGHPGENAEEFEETRRFLVRIRQLTDCVHINPCYVLRGSELYSNHKKWGIVLPENYVTDWFLSDGSNNPQIRMERVRQLLRDG
jgi:radical SAM superfamily enzyme YgiQ (UPF0313 family)